MGSVDGQSLVINNGFAVLGTQSPYYAAAVTLTSWPNACTRLVADPSTIAASASVLGLIIENTGPLVGLSSPTTFNIVTNMNPPGAAAVFDVTTSSCGSVLPGGNSLQATSGTVTLTSVSSTNVTGTFSVDFGSTVGTLTGSFSAPVCAGLSFGEFVDPDAGAATCEP